MTASVKKIATHSGTRRSSALARQHISRFSIYLIALIGALFFSMPFFWSLSSALKGPWEILEYPPSFLPKEVRWQNFPEVFRRAPYSSWAFNTLVVASLSTLGDLISSTLTAYGFSRFRFPGRSALFLILLSTLMLPWQVTIIPRFLLFRSIGWLDTLNTLIVPSWLGGSAFYIFLLRQFFMTIPLDFDDAARIDGGNFIHIYWHVIMPLSVPALTSVVLFSLLANWGEFIGPLIFLNTPGKFTLALGLRYFEQIPETTGEPRQHLLMAASLMMVLPVVIIFFAGQKYFVRGVIMSGLKG